MLNIYLADLVYDSTETNHVVPLNVACLAAYAKNIFGNSVKINIYRGHPQKPNQQKTSTF